MSPKTERMRLEAMRSKMVEKEFVPAPGAMPCPVDEQDRRRGPWAGRRLRNDLELGTSGGRSRGGLERSKHERVHRRYGTHSSQAFVSVAFRGKDKSRSFFTPSRNLRAGAGRAA